MVVDYSGGNLEELKNGFDPTSIDYNQTEDRIYYTNNSGTIDIAGVGVVNEDGSLTTIYSSSSCFSARVDEAEGRIYFIEGTTEISYVNMNGSGYGKLDQVGGGILTGFNVNKLTNEFY